MRTARMGTLMLVLCAFGSGAASAASIDDKASREVLSAMARTSTWGHPDEQGEFEGMQHYANHDYGKAMESFLAGARYADKLSQLSIGLMYLNGEGVEKDPVKAYAWIALAAERKYPVYVVTRDKLWKSFDDTQRAQARAMLDELMPEYGDAVAKVRMERALRMARTQMTGSLVGFGSAATTSVTPAQFTGGASSNWMPQCGGKSIDGAPILGCSDLFVAWRWDARQYFQVRDAVWFGTVKVGTLEPAGSN